MLLFIRLKLALVLRALANLLDPPVPPFEEPIVLLSPAPTPVHFLVAAPEEPFQVWAGDELRYTGPNFAEAKAIYFKIVGPARWTRGQQILRSR